MDATLVEAQVRRPPVSAGRGAKISKVFSRLSMFTAIRCSTDKFWALLPCLTM